MRARQRGRAALAGERHQDAGAPSTSSAADICLLLARCADWSLAVQIQLARRLPFCYATFLGTHNSGISLADGYGNLDADFQQYFKWISWVVRLLPAATLCSAICHILLNVLATGQQCSTAHG